MDAVRVDISMNPSGSKRSSLIFFEPVCNVFVFSRGEVVHLHFVATVCINSGYVSGCICCLITTLNYYCLSMLSNDEHKNLLVVTKGV